MLTLAVTSKTEPLTKVHDLVDTRLAQKISQIPGVGLVNLEGGQKPGVRIRANPTALAAYGLNIDDLRTTISNANVNTPKGNFDGPARASPSTPTTRSPIPTRSATSSWPIATARRCASATSRSVEEGQENNRHRRLGEQHPGRDRERPAPARRQRHRGRRPHQGPAADLRETLPNSLDVAVLTDRTLTIRASVRDVQIELSFAVVLVVAVIFVFLGDARATLIPSLSVPLSLVGTLAVMYLADFSLNNLSIMALTIATGFVVDDAIVMIENIARYIERGEDPKEAALKGSSRSPSPSCRSPCR